MTGAVRSGSQVVSSSTPVVQPGVLYVVATPIGNLADISQRALQVLAQVDAIAAEDTRHSRHLLQSYGISRPLLACHQHNESRQAPGLISRLRAGQSLALITDAGTPGVSDPGARVVRRVRDAGLSVQSVPGPSAVAAALSISGMTGEGYLFAGFLPARGPARVALLQTHVSLRQPTVYFEAPHRIVASLADCIAVFGAEREVCLVREISKRFETVVAGTLGEVARRVAGDPDQQRGEMVLIVAPTSEGDEALGRQLDAAREPLLAMLTAGMGVRQATAVVVQLTELPRNRVYALAQKLKSDAAGSVRGA